jgi:flagellar biosynthesis/type III secretory pathway protein FliH
MSSLIKNAIVGQETIISLGGKTPTQAPAPAPANKAPMQEVLEKELAQLKQKAMDDGYNDGKKAAQDELKKLSQQLQQKQNAIESSFKELNKTYERDLLTAITELKKHQDALEGVFETRLLTLALTCIYKLAGNKDIYKCIVEESVKRCLKQGTYTDKIYLRLPESSSEHLSFLTESLKENCVVVFESGLESGRCFVSSAYSTEDLSVQTQLEQLKEQFFAVWDVKKSNA